MAEAFEITISGILSMICMLCKHDKSEHNINKMNIQYCWECNKQWPPKYKTVHNFTDNLKYLELKYEEKGSI
jgi:hypothetical protein